MLNGEREQPNELVRKLDKAAELNALAALVNFEAALINAEALQYGEQRTEPDYKLAQALRRALEQRGIL